MSYILGLDLGETSLGIATLNEKNGEPISLDQLGVRIFPNGREDKTKTPLAVKRREARGIRRNLDRRLKRKEKLIKFLIDNNLISQNEEERLKLKSLNPYELRVKGLDEKLTLNELSRALIHINQRRGFLSNRKSDKQQKDSSDMKTAIKETIEKIVNNNCRTLGEYLYSLQKEDNHSLLRVKPEEIKKEKVVVEKDKKTGEETEKKKVVNTTEYNYFANRQLYIDETKLILDKQSEFYPQLNNKIFDEDLNREISIKDKIIDIIFFQRKLKPQEVGKCQFEENEYRCPKASPLFQEYRILCELNNLELLDFNNGVCLSVEDKNRIKQLLMSQKEVKFSAMRKKLNIPEKLLFNLESEKRDRLEGEKTSYELSKKENFGELWKEISEDKREEVIDKLLNEENEDNLTKYLKENFKNLNKEQIENIKNAKLPDGYASLSLKAIRKLIPYLREGKRYDEACEIVYSSHSIKNNTLNLDKLPYYGEILKTHVIGGTTDEKDKDNPEKYFGKITNPTVHIGLNQLRYCINKIIEEKGKPEYIAIELARELKLNKKQKASLKAEQEQNLKDNETINKKLKELGQTQNYDNRMLYKIWERLSLKDVNKRCCPYCGKPISVSDLFSGNVHIEHILPFSRTYDDSINNKVIACSSCNNEKGNQSPFEAWGHDTEKYNDIMSRVEFLPKKMQWRFEKNAMEKFNDENKILARMLSDTQYLSTVACEYLSRLYPNDGKKHIRTIPGQLTEKLRHHWGLNKLISGDEDIKDRKDHRHHAVDAFVVACTTQSTLNKVSKASGQNKSKVDKLIENLEPPFEKFNLQDIQRVVDNIIISYKEDHKCLNKAKAKHRTTAVLHDGTNYGFINGNLLATRIKIINIAPEQEYSIKKVLNNINVIAQKTIREYLFKKIVTEDAIKKFFTNDFFIKKENKIIEELTKGENLKYKDKNDIKKIIKEYSDITGTKRVRIHETFNENSYVKFKLKSRFENTIGSDIEIIKSKLEDKNYKYAKTNGNYCAEIYMPKNKKKNNGKWCLEVISNFDAHQKDFKPKWRIEEPEAKLIMRLFINDTVEIEVNDSNKDSAIKKLLPFAKDNKIITRVKKMSNGIIYLRPHNVAKENKDGELTWQGTGSGLQIANVKKVRISPLGKITYLKK